MGKSKLARPKECSRIVSLAPMRLFNTKKHFLNGRNQEIEPFSGTKIPPDLEVFSEIEGIL